MTEFKNLTALIDQEYATRRNDYRFYIENGYFPTWAAEHRNNPDQGLRAYSTPAKWSLYQAGSITREKAVEIAIKRALKEIDKKENEMLTQLATIANTPAVKWCTISVEWVKNRYWGNNPHTTITTDYITTYGKAGGCGYDKESAAIANALNENPAILRVLYDAAEKALTENTPPKRYSNGNYTWRDNVGYGSGYSVLPYFEGGAGVSCFWSIFEKCGYKCKLTASGKMYDHYTITKGV